MIRQTLVLPCDHPECPNTLTLGADEPQPKRWLCPVCEDRVLEQQITAMAEVYGRAPNTLLSDITFKPIN